MLVYVSCLSEVIPIISVFFQLSQPELLQSHLSQVLYKMMPG